MKREKIWIMVMVAICASVVLSINVLGISHWEKFQIEQYGTSTLKGLKGVAVLVRGIKSGHKNESVPITEDTLQTQVELELRKAGIKVFNDANEFLAEPHAGILWIQLSLLKVEKDPIYVGSFSCVFSQEVVLSRNPKIMTKAITWPNYPADNTFYAGQKVVEQYIKDLVTKNINEFCNDYLAANQEEHPIKKQIEKPLFDSIWMERLNGNRKKGE